MNKEPPNILFEDSPPHTKYLTGLARQCPKCRLIAHYRVKGRRPVKIKCVECGHEFLVQKYARKQRPKADPTLLDSEGRSVRVY